MNLIVRTVKSYEKCELDSLLVWELTVFKKGPGSKASLNPEVTVQETTQNPES